jgi:predicted phage-related endonuclease
MEGCMSPQIKPADRRHFIGGSDARIVMGTDEAALVRLWREKRGDVEPEDLSGNLIVQLGLATEDLNRRWYEANRWGNRPAILWIVGDFWCCASG